jgi:hypothetical protein
MEEAITHLQSACADLERLSARVTGFRRPPGTGETKRTPLSTALCSRSPSASGVPIRTFSVTTLSRTVLSALDETLRALAFVSPEAHLRNAWIPNKKVPLRRGLHYGYRTGALQR